MPHCGIITQLQPDVDWSLTEHFCFRAGAGNLRPTWTFDMASIRIFVTEVRVQRRVKTMFHDKLVLRW